MNGDCGTRKIVFAVMSPAAMGDRRRFRRWASLRLEATASGDAHEVSLVLPIGARTTKDDAVSRQIVKQCLANRFATRCADVQDCHADASGCGSSGKAVIREL